MAFLHPANCPWCNSDAKLLWPEARVWRFRSCSLLFRSPAPAPAQLENLYRKSWTDPILQKDETGATDEKLAHAYVHHLAKSLGKTTFQGLRILDYGAGRGAMTKALLAEGADVYCVEPYGCLFLQQSGFKAFPSVPALPQGLVFDGILSLDVAEHLPAPWDDYQILTGRLKESGWLYLSTPNAAGVNARFTRGKWREIKNQGHLFFFTPSTLERMLAQNGFKNFRRLRWYIIYHKGPMKFLSQRLLQFLWIDGELRYLAFK